MTEKLLTRMLNFYANKTTVSGHIKATFAKVTQHALDSGYESLLKKRISISVTVH